MGTLAEELFKRGLASQRQFAEVSATQSIAMEGNRPQSQELPELNRCKTMSEFKQVAKELLLCDPSKIGEVLSAAHRFKKGKGGKKFVWIFFQLRDELAAHPDKVEQLIRRALRRSGTTLEVPEA